MQSPCTIQYVIKRLQFTAKAFEKWILAQKQCCCSFKNKIPTIFVPQKKNIDGITTKFMTSKQFWCDNPQSNFHQEGHICSWSCAFSGSSHFSSPLCISSHTQRINDHFPHPWGASLGQHSPNDLQEACFAFASWLPLFWQESFPQAHTGLAWNLANPSFFYLYHCGESCIRPRCKHYRLQVAGIWWRSSSTIAIVSYFCWLLSSVPAVICYNWRSVDFLALPLLSNSHSSSDYTGVFFIWVWSWSCINPVGPLRRSMDST